jgi:type II restriction/modification system DNA methylase subunit YeeA
LAEILYSYGEKPQEIAPFLIRLLFCLFAEDVGLLPPDIFTNLVQHARTKPQAFVAQLRQLFDAMSTGGWFGPEEILHIDGRLFDDDKVLELDSESMDILISVSTLDWSSIEPSIFGTLFERSLDPGKRSQLGAHYTSREDILLIVEPVLMAPLRRRWTEIRSQSKELASKIGSAKKGQRTRLRNSLSSLLLGFAEELSKVQVLDPACGSGNFLYVALRQLLNLWKEVSILAGELGLPRIAPALAPSPAQLHGIEISEYAHQLAQATIWIGYIQWFRENGFGFPSQPILKPLDNILLMDAILDYDVQGNPIEPEWPKADVIIGNPPFLGSRKMRTELGEEYVDAIVRLYGEKIPPKSDYVCYWFEKTREYIDVGNSQRSGLIATQAIRKGLSRTVLDRIKNSGDIFLAYSDKPWILDGADVRVSIVGFDNGSVTLRLLEDIPVKNINSDLSSSIDVTTAQRLYENFGVAYPGTKKYGPFDIKEILALDMLADTGNPNKRPNSDVVKPWVNGSDIARRRRGMWIIDFGVDMSLGEASQYEKPFEYILKNVKPTRSKVRVQKTRDNWWIFERPRPGMRLALSKLDKFIVTPVVAKYRLFAFLEQPTIPDSKLTVFARDDYYFVGILHSRIHEVWTLNNCAWHGVGNDPTYNTSTCFDTFPFPWPPSQEPLDDSRVQAIAQCARELVEKRDAWLNPSDITEAELNKRTLTNLYNQRPTWLDLAHRKLDEAVFAAYGWQHDLADEQILEHLLALNLERAAQQK